LIGAAGHLHDPRLFICQIELIFAVRAHACRRIMIFSARLAANFVVSVTLGHLGLLFGFRLGVDLNRHL
jgi:hypothetical protein